MVLYVATFAIVLLILNCPPMYKLDSVDCKVRTTEFAGNCCDKDAQVWLLGKYCKILDNAEAVEFRSNSIELPNTRTDETDDACAVGEIFMRIDGLNALVVADMMPV